MNNIHTLVGDFILKGHSLNKNHTSAAKKTIAVLLEFDTSIDSYER